MLWNPNAVPLAQRQTAANESDMWPRQLSFRKEMFSKKESQSILLNGKQSLGLHRVKGIALSQFYRDNNLGPR